MAASTHEVRSALEQVAVALLKGITAEDRLQAWRIGVESVREEALTLAQRLGIADQVMLELVKASVQWGDVGMSHVYRTGQPARIDDYAAKDGPIAQSVRSMGIRSVVGTPILVLGQMWGAMVHQPLLRTVTRS
jgi:GAF domain-containing protein